MKPWATSVETLPNREIESCVRWESRIGWSGRERIGGQQRPYLRRKTTSFGLGNLEGLIISRILSTRASWRVTSIDLSSSCSASHLITRRSTPSNLLWVSMMLSGISACARQWKIAFDVRRRSSTALSR